MQPCNSENQITYLYFCTLGGLNHPRTAKILRRNGSHTYFTYHLREY
jgi:hypothetical protein